MTTLPRRRVRIKARGGFFVNAGHALHGWHATPGLRRPETGRQPPWGRPKPPGSKNRGSLNWNRPAGGKTPVSFLVRGPRGSRRRPCRRARASELGRQRRPAPAAEARVRVGDGVLETLHEVSPSSRWTGTRPECLAPAKIRWRASKSGGSENEKPHETEWFHGVEWDEKSSERVSRRRRNFGRAGRIGPASDCLHRPGTVPRNNRQRLRTGPRRSRTAHAVLRREVGAAFRNHAGTARECERYRSPGGVP